MKEIKIVKIAPVEGAKVEKNNGIGAHRYFVPVTYHLEDGTTVTGRLRRHLLRDIKAELATLPKEVNNIVACFNDKGEFWGTQVSYNIGRQN
jgi:hypothetical protein